MTLAIKDGNLIQFLEKSINSLVSHFSRRLSNSSRMTQCVCGCSVRRHSLLKWFVIQTFRRCGFTRWSWFCFWIILNLWNFKGLNVSQISFVFHSLRGLQDNLVTMTTCNFICLTFMDVTCSPSSFPATQCPMTLFSCFFSSSQSLTCWYTMVFCFSRTSLSSSSLVVNFLLKNNSGRLTPVEVWLVYW